MISSNSFRSELEAGNEEFNALVTSQNTAIRSILEPYREKMQGMAHNFDQEFGDYLMRVLGGKVNNQKAVNDSDTLMVSRSFYGVQWGKKVKVHPMAMFHALGPKYLELINNPRQREIVKDFLSFQQATANIFKNFNQKQEYNITTPLQLVDTEHVLVSPSVVTKSVPSHYNYIVKGSNKTITPTSVRLVFDKRYIYPYHDNNSTLNGNNQPPRVQILLLGSNCLLGCYNICFTESSAPGSLFEAFEFVNEHPTNYNCKIDLSMVGEDNPDHLTYITLYQFREGSKTFTGLNQGDTYVQKDIAKELGVTSKQLTPNSSLIINWSEVLQDPVIQSEIKRYIETWDLISRAWSYIQTKYSHRLITGGHF